MMPQWGASSISSAAAGLREMMEMSGAIPYIRAQLALALALAVQGLPAWNR